MTQNAPDAKALVTSTKAAQARAADPTASAWVSANAGTGKTHVLVSRVLRLLLAGTKPERILCLTFTKAAAAEMSTRVFKHLAEWVSAPDEHLRELLAELLQRVPTADESLRARQLFALAIETPGGLKVQTIHAFCERLLQRFPLEAGVPPGFSILDDEHMRALMREATDQTLSAAASGDDEALRSALQTVVVHAADDRFDQLLSAMIAKRDWLDAARPDVARQVHDFSEAERRYRAALGIAGNPTLESISGDICRLLPKDLIARAIAVLSGGSANDMKAAARLRPAVAATSDGIVSAFTEFFLTGEGKRRASLITNPTAKANPGLKESLEAAQDSFIQLHALHCALQTLDATMALLRLADAVQTGYTRRKTHRAALDYDDLIRRAASLLTEGKDASNGVAQWVLFKLDGGLDHILVDEAQDTSPTQWQVIRNLAEEFFSDATGHGNAARTVFAVGDEKQSIYGFQGAAPRMLAEVGAQFAQRVRQAERAWHDVSLTLSFRSTGAVLGAIDDVFADPHRTPGIGASILHQPFRIGHAGHVEIWETEQHIATDDSDAFAPLGDHAASSPHDRLAARIAEQIQHWLTSGERLEAEDRPIRAGDILILVRQRRAFSAAMIAALKQRGIPVSGADRMKLENQIAVQDLIAVGEVVLLPEDDLALASVLKSPLIGLDDDDLLRFAPERKSSLWSALIEGARNGDSRLAAAAEIVKRWRRGADYRPPFEFYAELLDAEGGRAKLLQRLGPEAADAIDEFMNLALRYDEAEPPSLQGFLDYLRKSQREIKRDLDQGGGMVRVMTVHGAKGLEAPIVFLPDTCSTKSGGPALGLVELSDDGRGGPSPVLWQLKTAKNVANIVSAKAFAVQSESEERNRLLYVALTRARDRLYISGFEGKKGRQSDCWYDLILAGLGARLEAGTAFDGRPVQRIKQPQTAKPTARTSDVGIDADPIPLPSWALTRPPREPAPVVPIAPSRLAPLDIDVDGEPVEPPKAANDLLVRRAAPGTTVGGANRFLRGTITHALLQYLPTLPADQWELAAGAFVSLRGAVLPARIRTSIVKETLAVLHHPTFSDVFGPRSRAEVAIVAEIPPPGGKGSTVRIAGQIDRLVDMGDTILIVDYKTNRPPPQSLTEVPLIYIHQLAGYRLAIQKVFGTSNVRAALLWTEGATMMELAPEQLDSAATELFTLT